MEPHLGRLRKQAGLTQETMAKMLKVKKRTYGSWERQKTVMSLEQAYNCAIALGCTINDLVGMKSDRSYADPRQAAVNGHFETFNDSGKTELATIAERMSHDPSIRIEKNGDEHIPVQKALGA